MKPLLIDSTPAGRSMLTDVIRELDILDFIVVHGIKEALDILGTEEIHWIITPVETGQDYNSLHLLRILSENSKTQNIQVTLMVDSHELSAIPVAFERGLHSWFERAKSKNELKESLRTIIRRFERYHWDPRQCSAANLRDYLIENEQFEDLVSMEKNLVDHYKSNPNNLLLLAEAYFLNGEVEIGKSTLWQCKLLDDRLEDSIIDLCDTYLDGETLEAPEETFHNALGLESAVVIDSDPAIQNAIKRVLDGIGIPNVEIFSNGLEAWEWLEKNPEPEMILMEWRLPSLPAPSLVQRIRQHGMVHVPITIVSGLVSQEDMPLLYEMGISHLINKPINKKQFLQSLVHYQVQQKEPTEQKHLIHKMRVHLSEGKIQQAKEILAGLINDPNIPEIRQSQLKGELAFYNQDYSMASKLLLEAVRVGGNDTLIALNLLGKSLIKLGDYKSSLECFNRAKEISPKNIERLCTISEVYTEMGEIDSAKEIINDASKIDEENILTQQASARLALETGQEAKAKSIMDSLSSMDEVISSMNNRAISLTRSGHFEQGVKIYQRTLDSIPESRLDKKAIVIYNLALNQIRNGSYEDAFANLEKAVSISKKFKIHKKCLSVKSQLKRAMEAGKKVNLSSSQANPEAVALDSTNPDELEKELKKIHKERINILKNNQSKPLYKFSGDRDNFLSELLATEPSFTLREVIKKDQ